MKELYLTNLQYSLISNNKFFCLITTQQLEIRIGKYLDRSYLTILFII